MPDAAEPPESLVRVSHVIYALYAASFVIGLTAIVAIVLDYVHRAEAEGTWLASHFRWRIRTFWFSVLWSALLLAAAVAAAFAFFVTVGAPIAIGAGLGAAATVLVGAALAVPTAVVVFLGALLAVSVWVVYRIVRGWTALASRRPLPV